MTLRTAYDRLRARWPGQSFLIQMDLWHFHDTRQPLEVSWRIYDAEARTSWTGKTLEGAMELALGCDADLGTLDTQLDMKEVQA